MNKNLMFSFLILCPIFLNAMGDIKNKAYVNEAYVNGAFKAAFERVAPEHYKLWIAGKMSEDKFFAFYEPTKNEPRRQDYYKAFEEYIRLIKKYGVDSDPPFPYNPIREIFKMKVGSMNQLKEIEITKPVPFNYGGPTIIETEIGRFEFPFIGTGKDSTLNGKKIQCFRLHY